MRKVFKFLSIGLFLFILSCSDESAVSDAQNIEFGFDTMSSHYSTKKGSSLQFNCKGAQSMDLIELYINEEKAETWTNPSSDKFETLISLDLGIYPIEIRAYQKSKLISADARRLIVNASTTPKNISFDFISSHPHNPTNFTQGYEFSNGKLFESTGNPNNDGSTKVAEINQKTGISIREIGQPNPIFGEGITILGNKLYQISWQNQKCFVYDVNTFELDTSYIYHGEGWGLCNDGKYIIMSNGTHELVYRDSDDFSVIKTLSVHTDRAAVTNLNELEFCEGYIYANIWTGEQRRQQDSRIDLSKIVRIDASTGVVDGIIDIRELIDKSFKKGVPNGIAYRKSNNKFWLTGKYWNEAYEISINP